MTKPTNLASLKQRIQNLEGDQLRETQRQNLMALVVLSQMLPKSAVKGGSAMVFRYGPGARTTKDLDAARPIKEEQFIEELAENLERGWQGFTGRIKHRAKPQPAGIPEKYIMAPFDIKLQYEGRDWKTVPLELGHSELGSAETDEAKMSNTLSSLFTELGFDAPTPVRVMKAEHQIAQIIHAATLSESARAHDLVDLQILVSQEEINLPSARAICESTFAYRSNHPWPPTFRKYDGWNSIYAQAAEALALPDVTIRELEDAIVWGNNLINRIAQS
jgi:hypothetical protein